MIIFWLIVDTLVGALIGKSKNRKQEGAVWGFFLGIIGWLIVALKDPRECPEESYPLKIKQVIISFFVF